MLGFRSSFVATLLLLTSALIAHGQVIKGSVIDAQTREPLPFANVFLNNTTKGTVTDGRGEFLLRLLHEPGTYELVVSFVGYETYRTALSIAENELMSASIALKPEERELSAVTVNATRDKSWEKNLKRFESAFLGKDLMADSCRILNPWILDFVQEKGGKLQAFANGPLEIENYGLGYKLLFFLRFFWVDRTSYFIAGQVKFEELRSMDEQQMLEWQTHRRISYLRSRHHLFKSMIQQKLAGEGFSLYRENPDHSGVREENFSDNLNTVLFPVDTTQLVTPEPGGNFRIHLKGKTEVHYRRLRAGTKVYRDVSYPVSWLQFRSNSILVNKDGYEVTPEDVTVSGDMSADRVSRMLPIDYKPNNVTTLIDLQGDFMAQFREKIYVHTNKPYYYPGEPIWFKGYVNYSTPIWSDSLSRTVYIEMISPQKKLLLSRTAEIKSGSFHNDFILPDSIPAGNYYLRAYTNFSRNFGDSTLFVRPVPILNVTDRVDPNQDLNSLVDDSTFMIFPSKQKVKPREKVTLTIQTLGDDGLPVSANLSLSVTDDQVIAVKEPVSILHDFPFTGNERRTRNELSFPIEYGVGFSGRFLDDNGKPELTIISGIQFEPQNLFFTQSDENGVFAVGDLQFQDTSQIALKSDKAVNAPYGRFQILDREPAAMHFPDYKDPLALLPNKNKRWQLSAYDLPKDARLLEEVEVRAKRITDVSTDRVRRPYGKADYVLTPKDFNNGTGNLLLALPGKVPGLMVRQTNNEGQEMRWVVYLQRSASLSNPPEVIVTINDNFVTGRPADILAAIDPSSIESIEVKVGVNVLYGGFGGGGVISIYTKTEPGQSKENVPPNFQMVKIVGYNTAHQFRSPNYEDSDIDPSIADFRSTIYWNPTIVTDPHTGTAEVSFYAADIPGGYRIVAEGVTSAGQPKRCEYFIQVER